MYLLSYLIPRHPARQVVLLPRRQVLAEALGRVGEEVGGQHRVYVEPGGLIGGMVVVLSSWIFFFRFGDGKPVNEKGAPARTAPARPPSR